MQYAAWRLEISLCLRYAVGKDNQRYIELKHRNIIVVVLLSVITLGIYDLYWLVSTKKVLNERTKVHVPSIWLLFAPVLVLFVGAGGMYALAVTGTHLGGNSANIIVLIVEFVAVIALIPITLYWYYKYSKAVSEYTSGRVSTAMSFLLLWLIRFIGIAVIQDDFNGMVAAGTQPSTPGTQPTGPTGPVAMAGQAYASTPPFQPIQAGVAAPVQPVAPVLMNDVTPLSGQRSAQEEYAESLIGPPIPLAPSAPAPFVAPTPPVLEPAPTLPEIEPVVEEPATVVATPGPTPVPIFMPGPLPESNPDSETVPETAPAAEPESEAELQVAPEPDADANAPVTAEPDVQTEDTEEVHVRVTPWQPPTEPTA